MNKYVLPIMLLALIPLFATGRPKLTVYYPVWCQLSQDNSGYGIPAWNINWAGIDYVVHFTDGNVSQTSPYFIPASGVNTGLNNDSIALRYGPDRNGIAYGDSLITVCHRNGVKVLLTLQAATPTNLDYVAADSARSEMFANAAAGFAQRRGYDGLELDWENPTATDGDANRLVRILRRRLNDRFISRPLLFTSAGRFDWDYYWATQDTAIDMHNLQMYSYALTWNGNQGRNQSYFQTPIGIEPGAPAGLQSQSMNRDYTTGKTFPQLWQEAGHQRSKIGLGIGAYGQVFTGITTWGANYSSYENDIGLQDVESMTGHGGTYTFYTQAKSPGISGTVTSSNALGLATGTQFYITFDSDSSIAHKVLWADSQGVGGLMIYDTKGDMHTGRAVNNRLPTIYKAISVLQSLAPSAPSITTTAATSITQTSATLNGTVNANGASTTVRFLYGTVSGTYSDSVVAAESPIPSGFSSVTKGLTGLTAGATYYYKVRGYNMFGSVDGAELSFTANPTTVPATTTNATTSVTQNTATVNGTVNANGAGTTVRFLWGRVSGTYTDSATAVQSPVNGSTPTAVSFGLTGLLPNTTYYVRVRGYNTAGGSQGSQISFKTVALPPTTVTNAATSVSLTAATVNGSVTANGVSTTVRFVWGIASDTYTDSLSASQSPVTGSSPTSVSRGISGLLAGSTYFVRVRGYSSGGNSQGGETSFTTTSSAPTASTSSASNIMQTSATLNGIVNANGSSTSVRFVYGPAPGVYTDSSNAMQSPVTGNAQVSVGIIGLNPNSTYYYRVKASSALGSLQGNEVSFVTTVVSHTYSVAAGWNMISIPITVPDPRVSSLFPTAVSQAYAFVDPTGYAARDSMRNKAGYWLNISTTQSVSIYGWERTRDSINVVAGWNLVGTISYPVSVDSVEKVPSGIGPNDFFTFRNSYERASVLEPGRAYWFKASISGLLIIHR